MKQHLKSGNSTAIDDWCAIHTHTHGKAREPAVPKQVQAQKNSEKNETGSNRQTVFALLFYTHTHKSGKPLPFTAAAAAADVASKQ